MLSLKSSSISRNSMLTTLLTIWYMICVYVCVLLYVYTYIYIHMVTPSWSFCHNFLKIGLNIISQNIANHTINTSKRSKKVVFFGERDTMYIDIYINKYLIFSSIYCSILLSRLFVTKTMQKSTSCRKHLWSPFCWSSMRKLRCWGSIEEIQVCEVEHHLFQKR